ncbi:MAG: hypothetical protein E3J23_08510 [Candidatus Stahlbacteria bacterium]|nr:MAG: hypothetical protein E3J23_08510 [Candidatus Stahlbacteria bacterium]
MIIIKKKLVQIFAAITRRLSISLSKEVQRKNKDLIETELNNNPKLKTQWYKCGKCRNLIEIVNMKFEYDKKFGRVTKCPFCKNKIYIQRIPKDLKYNKAGNLVKEKVKISLNGG